MKKKKKKNTFKISKDNDIRISHIFNGYMHSKATYNLSWFVLTYVYFTNIHFISICVILTIYNFTHAKIKSTYQWCVIVISVVFPVIKYKQTNKQKPRHVCNTIFFFWQRFLCFFFQCLDSHTHTKVKNKAKKKKDKKKTKKTQKKTQKKLQKKKNAQFRNSQKIPAKKQKMKKNKNKNPKQ